MQQIRSIPSVGQSGTSEIWQALAEASDESSLYAAWLGVLASRLSGAHIVCLLRRQGVAEFQPIGQTPSGRDPRSLERVVQSALTSGDLAREPCNGGEPARLAFPVEVAMSVEFVVAAELQGADDSTLQSAVREIFWASAWLKSAVTSEGAHAQDGAVPGGMELLQLLQCAETGVAAALTVCNELSTSLGASRVSLALRRGDDQRLMAISDLPWFDRRSASVSQIESVARECAATHRACLRNGGLDQPAHNALAMSRGAAILSVKFEGRTALAVGVLVLERDGSLEWSAEEQQRLERLGRLLGPTLQLLDERDRWWTGRAAQLWQRLRIRLADRRRPALALSLSVLAAVLGVLVLVPFDARVTAPAVVEGARELSVAAAFDGFVARADRRAGETVRAGHTLAVLDDRQLQLDVERWESARVQSERRYNDALTRRDRPAAGQAQAAVQEAEAQLGLAQFRRERSELRAEADAFVVSGDLRQQIGAPVRKGQVLFRLAPTDEFRVVLRVDERDVRYVAPGQAGVLMLSGDVSRSLPVTVLSIGAPEAQDGVNAFRVEAALQPTPEDPPQLRPGMEGVAKLVVGRVPLAESWSRRLRQWLRLAWFHWLP